MQNFTLEIAFGYIGVDDTHPFYARRIEDIHKTSLTPVGKLSFAGWLKVAACNPYSEKIKKRWFVGFYNNGSPLSLVRDETIVLADILKKISTG